MERVFFICVFIGGVLAINKMEKSHPDGLFKISVAKACRENNMCSAKRIIDGRLDDNELGSELIATFLSHGISREGQEILATHCDATALTTLATELYVSCVDPIDVVDKRASSYHVVAASAILLVVTGTHIAIFVVWTFKFRKFVK